VTTESMFEDIRAELERARAKFPRQSVWITLAALTEEVGELNAAILQLNQEPDKSIVIGDVFNEAVQVAVMAMRVVLDTNLREMAL
jgi:NTP pyrophosphatase (non-canonical NTP hydrolase)